MKQLLFIAITFCIHAVHGQKTTVLTGVLPCYSGYQIDLLSVEDYIVRSKEVRGSSTIDPQGQFRFEVVDSLHHFNILLRVANREIPLLLQKGARQHVQFICPEKPEDLISPVAIDTIHIEPDSIRINGVLNAFNAALQAHFERFEPLIFYNKADSVNTLFKDSIRKTLSKELKSSDIIRSTVQYSLANLDVLSGSLTDLLAFDSLILQQPMHYQLPAYHTFLEQVLQPRLDQLMYTHQKVIKEKPSTELYSYLSQVIKNDSLLALRPDIAEYLLMNYIKQSFHEPLIEASKWKLLLNSIATQSRWKKHRILSIQIINHFEQLDRNDKAPGFALPDFKGIQHTLVDYEGKLVYIQFWASWSPVSLRDMRAIEALHKDNRKNVHFVSISIDRDREKAAAIAEGYKWDFLYFNQQFELLRDYGVKSTPLYVLLDPFGRIISFPAADPATLFRKLSEVEIASQERPASYWDIETYEDER